MFCNWADRWCRMVAPRMANLEGLMSFDDDIDSVSETFALVTGYWLERHRNLLIVDELLFLLEDWTIIFLWSSERRLQAGKIRAWDAGSILVMEGMYREHSSTAINSINLGFHSMCPQYLPSIWNSYGMQRTRPHQASSELYAGSWKPALTTVNTACWYRNGGLRLPASCSCPMDT